MRTLVGRSSILFVFFLLLFVFAAPARADEIVITSGSLTIPRPSSGPNFSFGNPELGFAVSNAGYERGDGGSFLGCAPCTAGQLISVNARFIGGSTLGFGPATVGGVNYERVYYQSAILDFNAPLVAIPLDNSPLVTINVPFTMTGNIGLWLDPDQPPAFFTTTVSGQGIATMQLSGVFTESHGWLYNFQSITYNFSPAAPAAVPEPATLILFGTGIAAVAARYRRRRHSKDQPER
ncbi:MAG TPA: PEP-CTERM sorting domain-containing protein [Pyrinomonadaceae bacterium]|nr:PEP-CTERM sorting domain-containing protein [Pyrinomonadaceae bacterium]